MDIKRAMGIGVDTESDTTASGDDSSSNSGDVDEGRSNLDTIMNSTLATEGKIEDMNWRMKAMEERNEMLEGMVKDVKDLKERSEMMEGMVKDVKERSEMMEGMVKDMKAMEERNEMMEGMVKDMNEMNEMMEEKINGLVTDVTNMMATISARLELE